MCGTSLDNLLSSTLEKIGRGQGSGCDGCRAILPVNLGSVVFVQSEVVLIVVIGLPFGLEE